jgi:hypothetical protein
MRHASQLEYEQQVSRTTDAYMPVAEAVQLNRSSCNNSPARKHATSIDALRKQEQSTHGRLQRSIKPILPNASAHLKVPNPLSPLLCPNASKQLQSCPYPSLTHMSLIFHLEVRDC